MCNKTSRINDYIVDEQIDVAILTETWLSGCEMDQKNIGDVTPSGYNFCHKAHRDDIKLDMHSAIKANSYESVHVTLTVGGSSVDIIIIICRLLPTKKNKVRSSDLFAKFATLIDELSSI